MGSNYERCDPAMERPEYPTSFGIFYPVDYIVIGLQVRKMPSECSRICLQAGIFLKIAHLFTCKEAAEAAARTLDENPILLPRLGWADKAVKIHLEAAKEGASFLVIYAPDKMSVERAMNVIRRVPFEFAHRYHRLAIEELV